MAYKKDTKEFYAEVNLPVRRAFQRQWKERKQSNNEATTAALRLWLSLPKEVQAILISCPEIDVRGVGEYFGRRLREALYKVLAHDEQSGKTRQENNQES
jgi:hypothetical protein